MARVKKGRPGHELFGEFLDRHGISNADAGRALHVSRPTVFAWRSGDKTPTAPHRGAIEKWTDGDVLAGSWPLSTKEAEQVAALKQVETFDSNGTEG